MRVLGVDPGLTRLGLALVDSGVSRLDMELRDVGVARSDAGTAIPDRLVQIASEVRQWLVSHQPDHVAIEQVFMQRNVSNALGTAQAMGVVSVLAREYGAEVTTYTPTQVKAAVTGHGGAQKEQVAAMVVRVLGLQAPPSPADAADAAAIAVCHVLRKDSPELRRPSGGAAVAPAQAAWVTAAANSRVTSWSQKLSASQKPAAVERADKRKNV